MLRHLQNELNELKLVSQLEIAPHDQALINELFLLTAKPRMYVLNVSEDVLGAANDLLTQIASGEDVQEKSLQGELSSIARVALRAKEEGFRGGCRFCAIGSRTV